MKEKESRDLRRLEEFELVNSANQGVFIEKDVYIQPEINKNGVYEYKIYDGENNEIGVVDENKKITLNDKYIQDKKIASKELDFDFDSKHIEVDVQEMLDKQLEKERKLKNEQNQKSKDVSTQNNKEQLQDEKKMQQEQENESIQDNKSIQIEDEELKEQGYNITVHSRIKDQRVIDSMVVTTVEPRSVIVAEVDGEFKFLGKEIGTGNIVELQEKAGGNTKSEEVNKFEGNVEKKKGRGTTMIMPDYKNEKGENLEFNIEKNGYGQIEVGYIGDLDGDKTREVIPVETDVVHPTMEEYQRAQIEKYQQYGNYNFVRDDAIMTGKEVEDRLAEEKESIRDEVIAELGEKEENPTLKELEDMIEEEKKEEEQKDQNEKEEEKDEEEWEFGRPRPRPRH